MIGISIANSLGLNRVSAGINPDAAAFIAAAGITGTTQVDAVNALVNGLQADGLWSKMKAVYPFVTDNRNLLSYTEDFSNAFWDKGGITVTANNTLAPNGTLTADKITSINGQTSCYVNKTLVSTSTSKTLSLYAKANGCNWVQFAFVAGTISRVWFNVSTGQVGTITGSITNAVVTNEGNGWYRISANMNTATSSINTFVILSDGDNIDSFTGNGVNGVYYWGAQFESGALTTYQPIATTQQAYIASQFKYNLKDPRDLDAAFRLVFNGGWTHSSTGATPNGTNGYADTKFNAVAQGLLYTNNHLSYYSRTAAAGGATQFYEIGSGNASGSTNLSLWTRRSTDLAGYDSGVFPSNRNTFANTNGQGFYNGTSNSTSSKYFKNGVNQSTLSLSASTFEPINIYLGGFNESIIQTYFSNKQTAFASIGDGLTDTEAANLYTRVQAFQTSLNRQVP